MPAPMPLAECVVDVRLSLGPDGVYWTLGLARTLPVWLVHAHWAIVDDPFYLEQDPLVRQLARSEESSIEECRTLAQQGIEIWRDIQQRWQLETWPNLYWSGDRALEAVLPKNREAGLVERHDALAAGLDQRRGRSLETLDALADIDRDALALAAALGSLERAPPILLTPLAQGEDVPALARHLDDAGILCRRIGEDGFARQLNASLAPALLGAGLATALATGGLRLAALQLLTPRALAIPACSERDSDADSLAWDAAAFGREADLWDQALAACWEVRCTT